MRYLLLGICLIGMFWCTGIRAGEKVITLATLDWSPYVGQTLQDQGYVTAIIRAALEKRGYEVRVAFYPWARALELTKNGEADALYPCYHNEERTKFFEFSEPLPAAPIVFMKTKKSDASWDGTLKSLANLKIGTVRGYTYGDKFDKSESVKKEDAGSDAKNLMKLFAGRIDAVLIDRLVADQILRKEMKDRFEDVEALKPVFDLKLLYLGISKRKENAAQMTKDFNAGLKAIKDDGTYESLLKKHKVHGLVTTEK